LKQHTNGTRGINIYLAGKINKNDWRHAIVNGLRESCLDFDVDEIPEYWPVLIDGIAKNRHYTGPYFIGCDHGCYHGKNSHGYGPGCGENDIDYPGTSYDKHCPYDSREEYVTKRCSEAIMRSDVVYAWIDDLTAFGTIFEIGLAIGLHKRVIVATTGDERTRDLWFMNRYILNDPRSSLVWASDALMGFKEASKMIDAEEKEKIRESKIESPIERQFYNAMGHDSRLEPQHEILANGHHYRADFAIPSMKIVIELDGHEYHKTKEQRTNDARRERDLQSEGWHVIRFTGTEIANSARDCASETFKFMRMAKA